MSWPILSVVTFLPLVGVAFILALRGDDETAIRQTRLIALWTTVFTFLLSLLIWINFDAAAPGFQFVEKHASPCLSSS
jgi:NADH-quinone oxidoreductase subunit M